MPPDYLACWRLPSTILSQDQKDQGARHREKEGEGEATDHVTFLQERNNKKNTLVLAFLFYFKLLISILVHLLSSCCLVFNFKESIDVDCSVSCGS